MEKVTAMDIFGQAILDRSCGIQEPLYFIVKGNKEEKNITRYLRKISELNILEKKLIDLAYGDILDVGCGTGNYIQKLKEQGNVIGIDISKEVIKVAHKLGNKECIQANIFNYNSKTKFDTITFLENNFGMATTKEQINKLITKLGELLKPNGQTLLIQRDIKKPEFVVNTITVEYKGKKADFEWAHFSKKYLKKRFEKAGLIFNEVSREILDDQQDWYLAKLTMI